MAVISVPALHGETVLVDGVAVDNVLVAPSTKSATDLTDPKLPAGARLDWELHFPKEYAESLKDATLTVRGNVCRVVGDPQTYTDDLTPLEWNRQVYAYSAGDWSAQIEIISTQTTLDALGDAVASETVVYSGTAQAMQYSGDVSSGTELESDEARTWYFVIPFAEAVAALSAKGCRVMMDGAAYSVRSIAKTDTSARTLTIKAVYSG